VSVEVLQEGTERLHANLTDVKMHLSNTLNDSACSAAQAASTCNIIRNSLNQLNINANFSGVRECFSGSYSIIALNKPSSTSAAQWLGVCCHLCDK